MRFSGNSVIPELGSTPGVFNSTTPLNSTPNSEVAVISLSGVRLSLNCVPKIPSAQNRLQFQLNLQLHL